MNIKSSNIFNQNFGNTIDYATKDNNVQNKDKNRSFLDKFETGIRNSADLNDTVQVPRTIFKGYLAFMAGATLTTFAIIAKKYPKFANFLNITAGVLMTWGTYSFVRPYIIKDSEKSK